MTGMQLIVPPLEGNSPQQGMARDQAPREFENPSNGVSQSNESRNSSRNSENVLSQELRESFEAMKTIWRQAGRDLGEETAASEELKRKEREQANETALAVDAEVSRWQNGIAELEAMLAAEKESEGDFLGEDEESSAEEYMDPRPRGYHAAPVPFPSLPPVVVPDDNEDEGYESGLSRTGSETGFVWASGK